MTYKFDLSWVDFKTEVTNRTADVLYVELSNEYYVFFIDQGVMFRSDIAKESPASADQTDFETNYKPNANQPHEQYADDGTQYVRVTEKRVGKVMQIKGFEITAAANQITNHDIKWTEDIEIVGGFADAFLNGTATLNMLGSKVQMQVVDVDNILGYGAGTVLNTFAVDIPVTKLLQNGCSALSTTAFDLLTGLYIRIAVDNQHATDTVYVAGSLKYYH